MQKINRIRVFATTDSPQTRIYGISRQLCRNGMHFPLRTQIKPPQTAQELAQYNVTAETVGVSNALLQLPGILEVTVFPYELSISLARVFDWTELEAQVLDILKWSYFPREDVQLER